MHLQVSIFLVCLLLIGGDSLKCHRCSAWYQEEYKDRGAGCTIMISKSGSQKRSIANGCSVNCVTGSAKISSGYEVKTKGCNLCCSEDGIYRGSFLLCPLISYFLFH